MTRTRLAVLLLLLGLAGAWWLRRDARGERGEADPVPVAPARMESAPGMRTSPTEELVTPLAEREAPAAVAPDPATTVSLRVLTRESFSKDAAFVGGIAFQVFAQRELAGQALPGLAFPPLALGAGDAPLVTGRTDEQGEARLELPRAGLRFADNGLPLVYGRVLEPGYQARTVNGFHHKGATECEVWLMVRRGATARGRVLDERGEPVAARVALRSWSTRSGVRTLGHGTSARLLAAGAFELDLDAPVVDGVLVADADAAGTGVLADVDLTLEAPPQDLRVVVSGPGVVRGRVLDSAGAPAAGVELFLLVAALDDERGTTVLPEPERSLREVLGNGRMWHALQSGPDGAFEARGMRAEPYVVRARTQQQSGYPHLLTPVPVRPDGAELVLQLARPHVVVRLLDAEGRAWSGPVPKLARPSLLSSLPQEWPAEPRVQLFRCAPDDSVEGEALAGKSSGPAEVVFEVSDGARYLVAAFGGGFDGLPRVVEVPEGSNAVPVELRARELGELGTVAVRVLAAGVDQRGGRGLEVVVESVPGAAPLLEGQRYSEVYPFRFRLPPGAYRVVAAGAGEVDFQHGILWHRRTLGRAEGAVEVRAGETHELVLELDAGARLELTLAGSAKEDDLAAIVVEHEWLGDPEQAGQRAQRAAEARLFLERPGRRSEPVLFSREAYGGTSAQGLHLFETWPLGKTQLSELLPSGRFTLVARLPGGRERRIELELREGETSALRVEF